MAKRSISKTECDGIVERLARAVKASAKEAARVEALLSRARQERRQERKRAAAQEEVKRGRLANIADTVVPPPAEQDRPGEMVPHALDNIAGTARRLSTRRRVTRIGRMARAGMIEKHHVAACEWYANAHGLGYDTIGVTAQYGEGCGGGTGRRDHHARYKAQREAREDYLFARAALPPPCLDIFEGVVLHGHPVSYGCAGREAVNRRRRFVLCADVLHGRIAHMLPIER